jgi:hypothetical protein
MMPRASSQIIRLQRLHCPMAYMQHEHSVVEQHKENPVRSPISMAVKLFADGFDERSGFGRQRASFRVLCKGLDSLAGAPQPCAGRARVVPANVAAYFAQIGFSLSGDDDPVSP